MLRAISVCGVALAAALAAGLAGCSGGARVRPEETEAAERAQEEARRQEALARVHKRLAEFEAKLTGTEPAPEEAAGQGGADRATARLNELEARLVEKELRGETITNADLAELMSLRRQRLVNRVLR